MDLDERSHALVSNSRGNIAEKSTTKPYAPPDSEEDTEAVMNCVKDAIKYEGLVGVAKFLSYMLSACFGIDAVKCQIETH